MVGQLFAEVEGDVIIVPTSIIICSTNLQTEITLKRLLG